MTAITEALTEARARTGLTDDALARVVGVRQATFTRWRNGTLAVADRHAPRLASLLGISSAEVAAMLRNQQPRANAIEKGTIGHLLRRFETRNGLTAQGAYEHLGIDVSTYHKWRKNQTVPAPAVIGSLAAGIGVPEQTVVMAVYRTELWRLGQKGSPTSVISSSNPSTPDTTG